MGEFEPKQFGKYYLLEKLAVGGMAEIYKAKTFGVDGFEKLLAVKKILPHCSADKEFITMLTDEAKLSVLLSHANIVQVYDLGKVGDDYFISMEFINGPNLRDIIYKCKDKNIPFPEALAVYIASEVCKGLDYAHRKTDQNNRPLNIVHRDISPQNILISYEGEVKIVDFGIAKAAMNISHTMAGILKGKIAYMSPEQALGKSVDYKTDIFSTGIVLYEMLTQEKLFTGESQFEVLKKIRTTKITEETLPDKIKPELRKILAKALAYYPKDRYDSAGQMQVDLTRYLYKNYVDFTPQQLATFVKTLFEEEIKKQQELAARDAALEAQTSSINIAEEALQENIVHREETAITLKHEAGTGLGTGYINPPPSSRWKNILKKSAVALTTLAFIGALGGAYWKFIHPIITKKMPTGTANIISEPQGARIFLNEKDTALITPAILDDLELNREYTVRLHKDGYIDKTERFTLENSEPRTLKVELQKITGTLNIATTPPGAAIYINGSNTGKTTPAEIKELEVGKEISVRLSLEGYRDREEKITLADMEPKKIEVNLEKILYGSIKISSTPPGASIFINGKPTGKTTPATISGLEQGKNYTISLSKNGYESTARTIFLGQTETAANLVLKEAPKEIQTETTQVGTATLKISSKPYGALIYLNGASTGKTTPAAIPNLEVGKTYSIRLVKEGYEEVTATRNISSAKQYNIALTLKKIGETTQGGVIAPPPPPPSGGYGSLIVKSNPPDADIYVNSEYRGKTQATIKNVPSGAVLVMVSKKGYQSKSTTVGLAPGETKEVSFVLTEGAGEVTIITTPPAANVVFDGQSIARTPVTVRNVRMGETHTVHVSLPGYKPWSFSFEMDKKSKTFNKNLEKE